MAFSFDHKAYKALSDTEKTIIDYIDEHQSAIDEISITMISRHTFTSTATVSRAIQHMGFSGGITELRYTINKSNQTTKSEQDAELSNINEILAKSYRESVLTIEQIKITNILQIVYEIKKARRVYLFALGSSAAIAEEFQDQLLYLGYQSILVRHEIAMNRLQLDIQNNDLAFIISVTNSSPALYKTAKYAKDNGATLVTCTCKENANIAEVADITLIGHSEPITHNKNIWVSTSRIPLLIILRTIIEYISI